MDHRISEDAAGQRLDKFVRRLLPELPPSALYRLIRTKKVRVNGRRADEGLLLRTGDTVSVRDEALRGPAAPRAEQPAPVRRTFDILHEDSHLLVCVKPAGLAMHPGSGVEGPTLVDQVRAYLDAPEAPGEFRPAPAHRIDLETSGIVVVAKTRQAIVRLAEIFSAGEAKKTYLVLAKGRIDERGVIDLPLPEHQQTAANRAQRGVNMQSAVTHWVRLGQAADAALAECVIETGRTHQIRRHFAAIGHPVAGDPRYGDFPWNRRMRAERRLRRMFLHAARLALAHPATGQPMTFRAPLPPELGMVLDALGLALPAKFPRG